MFKVGDVVVCYETQPPCWYGKVVRVDSLMSYAGTPQPIEVSFENEDTRYYTKEGFFYNYPEPGVADIRHISPLEKAMK